MRAAVNIFRHDRHFGAKFEPHLYGIDSYDLGRFPDLWHLFINGHSSFHLFICTFVISLNEFRIFLCSFILTGILVNRSMFVERKIWRIAFIFISKSPSYYLSLADLAHSPALSLSLSLLSLSLSPLYIYIYWKL